MERRHYKRHYEPLLTEFYPIKLIGSFISLDFIVGCYYNCSFCISKRHHAREELFNDKIILDNRVTAKKMYSMLKYLPSYEAGVQIRIGHDTDAGFQFNKSSELIDMIDNNKSICYLTRKSFSQEEIDYFSYKKNLLIKITATPRSNDLNVYRNPLNLVNSAKDLDNRMLYWVIGPLVHDNIKQTEELIKSLPKKSTIFLKKLNKEGLENLKNIKEINKKEYKRLVNLALKNHKVTEYFCNSLVRVNRNFFGVDQISKIPDPEQKEREISYCKECKSYGLCYGDVNYEKVYSQIKDELDYLELTLLDEPKKIDKRTIELTIKEPSSRGEETYLSNKIKPNIRIKINTREMGTSEGGCFGNIERKVLKRWYNIGFFPVTELNNISENTLEDITRFLKIKK